MKLRDAAVPCVLAFLAGTAMAQPEEAQEELRSDPPAPYHRPRYSMPYGVTDGPFPLHQVNVGPGGANILGDAANEPSIMVDPTAPNRIAIAWRQFDSVTSNFRQAGHAYSRDGGRTWTFPGVLDPGVFRSDPVIRSDNVGRIIYWSLTNATGNYTCQVFRSSDGGQTWGSPIEAYGGDKQWFDIDRTGGTGDGNFYGTWDGATAYTANGFTRSTDHGATFMSPVQVLGQPNWGTVAVGPNGEVYVVGNSNGNLNACIITKTVNANQPGVPTWSFSRTVNLGGSQVYYTQQPPNPEGLLGQFWVRVDNSNGPRRGWVYVLCSVHQTGSADPLDVMLARSTDGGNTWSAPVKVNDEPAGANAYQWFGTLGVSPNGRLDVVYNDTRNTGTPSRSELRYTSSVDGGVTWAPSMPVTGQFDSTIGFPNQNKIGDYYDIASDLTGCFVAMAATFNNEEDVYCIRIGPYDCNGNGIDDAVDIANGTETDCNANGIPDSCERAAGVPVVCICYANCDGSTVPPILNANDFQCFLNKFAAADPYANCDGSTVPPVLNANDFQCFLNKYAAGCS
jgi:hypothetical protein